MELLNTQKVSCIMDNIVCGSMEERVSGAVREDLDGVKKGTLVMILVVILLTVLNMLEKKFSIPTAILIGCVTLVIFEIPMIGVIFLFKIRLRALEKGEVVYRYLRVLQVSTYKARGGRRYIAKTELDGKIIKVSINREAYDGWSPENDVMLAVSWNNFKNKIAMKLFSDTRI